MRFARPLFLIVALASTLPAGAASSTADDDGWQAFGHALTLVQTLVGIAARSDDPQASLKGIDDVLAGRNAEANQAISGLLQDATSDMPPQYRDRVAAIGRDLTAAARKNIAAAPLGDPVSTDRALQARKDLTAMGLTYHDPKQFLEAVKRDDGLAVELYVAGRGVNLDARDADGKTALEIARARRNTRMEALLARSLPAAR